MIPRYYIDDPRTYVNSLNRGAISYLTGGGNWTSETRFGYNRTLQDRLDRFTAVIADRERRLLAYLAEPHTLDEIVQHRFVYRPQDQVVFADGVERRSMSLHLARLVRDGGVRELEPGLYHSAA